MSIFNTLIKKSFHLSHSDKAVPWNMMCGPSQLGQMRMDGE